MGTVAYKTVIEGLCSPICRGDSNGIENENYMESWSIDGFQTLCHPNSLRLYRFEWRIKGGDHGN